MGIWINSLLWLLLIMLIATVVYNFFWGGEILLYIWERHFCIYLGVKVLSHKLTTHLIFWGTATCFPNCNTLYSHQQCQVLHILNTCYCLLNYSHPKRHEEHRGSMLIRVSFPHDLDPFTSSLSWINEVWLSRALKSHPVLTLSICDPYTSVRGIWCKQIHPPECHCPRWRNGKQPACRDTRRASIPASGRIPWRRKWQPTPVFLPGKSHGERSLMSYSLWDRKSQTWRWLSTQ